jgi:hypothetical protein
VTAAACTAMGLILAGAACIWCAMGGPGAACLRRAIIRARWAWRCRGCPPPGSEVDPLDRDDMRAFTAAIRAWRLPAVPERTRT